MYETKVLGCVPHKGHAFPELKDSLHSMAVANRTEANIKEVTLVAGTGKSETKLTLQRDAGQGSSGKVWTIKHRGAWASRVSKAARNAPVSTFSSASSTCTFTSERAAIEFWKGLGFLVTSELSKSGSRWLCHSDGFGVDVLVSKVTDLRQGAHAQELQAMYLVECAITIMEEHDIVAAEKALLAFAQRLAYLVDLTAAH